MGLLDGEDAHRLAIAMAKWKLVPLDIMRSSYPALETEVFGMRFATPVGLAAGFDKDGEAVAGLHAMGFSFVEVGSVTPLPQDGNPKPRVFRLPQDEAVINRYGFNSAGHDIVLERLLRFRQTQTASADARTVTAKIAIRQSGGYTRNSLPETLLTAKPPSEESKSRDDVNGLRSSSNMNAPWARSGDSDTVRDTEPSPTLLGVNLGKNKTSSSPIDDYVKGVEKFADVADYLVINVSSPNTPGLRDMQAKAVLEELLDSAIGQLQVMTKAGTRRPPLLVKIAPDLTDNDIEDVVDVLLKRNGPDGVAGVIVSNTTITRPSTLKDVETAKEIGGLSGQPLKQLATNAIRRVFRASGGKLTIIGCGGISSGQDAYEKIRAGASLLQIYSALVFRGPPVVRAINRELSELLIADGFSSVEEAVGIDAFVESDEKAMKTFMMDTILERFEKDSLMLKEQQQQQQLQQQQLQQQQQQQHPLPT